MGARFLISRLSSLGDVACTLPVACALKAHDPECEISWVVDRRFAGIVECCQAVDRVIDVRLTLSPATWPKFEGTYDIAFDMQGLLKSSLPIAFAKATERLGYHWLREGASLFSDRVLPDPTSFHIVDQYVDVARAAGCDADRAEFRLQPNEADLAEVDAWIGEDPFVVVNAGAAWSTKRWEPSSFAFVADALADNGIRTVLIGTNADSDRQAAQAVADQCRSKPADLLGKTSVRQLVALLSRARAHLGGDTGSTHIAAALGIPAIGLYSITRPKRSCPYGQIDRCHYDPDSLAGISAQAVAETVWEAVS